MQTYQVTLRIQGIKNKSNKSKIERFSIGTTTDITLTDTILMANRLITSDYKTIIRAELELVSKTETKRVSLK